MDIPSLSGGAITEPSDRIILSWRPQDCTLDAIVRAFGCRRQAALGGFAENRQDRARRIARPQYGWRAGEDRQDHAPPTRLAKLADDREGKTLATGLSELPPESGQRSLTRSSARTAGPGAGRPGADAPVMCASSDA